MRRALLLLLIPLLHVAGPALILVPTFAEAATPTLVQDAWEHSTGATSAVLDSIVGGINDDWADIAITTGNTLICAVALDRPPNTTSTAITALTGFNAGPCYQSTISNEINACVFWKTAIGDTEASEDTITFASAGTPDYREIWCGEFSGLSDYDMTAVADSGENETNVNNASTVSQTTGAVTPLEETSWSFAWLTAFPPSGWDSTEAIDSGFTILREARQTNRPLIIPAMYSATNSDDLNPTYTTDDSGGRVYSGILNFTGDAPPPPSEPVLTVVGGTDIAFEPGTTPSLLSTCTVANSEASTTSPVTGSCDLGTGDNRLAVVWLHYDYGGVTGSTRKVATNVTIGGVQATRRINHQPQQPTNTYKAHEAWELQDPPEGSQTVSVSFANASTDGVVQVVAAVYENAGGIGYRYAGQRTSLNGSGTIADPGYVPISVVADESLLVTAVGTITTAGLPLTEVDGWEVDTSVSASTQAGFTLGTTTAQDLVSMPADISANFHASGTGYRWSHTNMQVTSGLTTGFAGGATALNFVPNTTSGGHRWTQSHLIPTGENVTLRAKMKPNGYNSLRFEILGKSDANANLATVNVDGSDGTSAISATTFNVVSGLSVTPIGSGWYQVEFTGTPVWNAGDIEARIYVLSGDENSTNSFSGNGTSGVLVDDVEVEVAGDYQALTFQPSTSVEPTVSVLEILPVTSTVQPTVGNSATVIAGVANTSATESAAFDSGSGLTNAVLDVLACYEYGSTTNRKWLTGLTYDGAALSRKVSVWPEDNSATMESCERWTLANPSEGSNTLAAAFSNPTTDDTMVIQATIVKNTSPVVGNIWNSISYVYDDTRARVGHMQFQSDNSLALFGWGKTSTNLVPLASAVGWTTIDTGLSSAAADSGTALEVGYATRDSMSPLLTSTELLSPAEFMASDDVSGAALTGYTTGQAGISGNTAALLEPNTTSTTHGLRKWVEIPNASEVTVSVGIKGAEKTSLRMAVLQENNLSNIFQVNCNTATGNSSSSASGTGVLISASSCTSLGSGWYRMSITGVLPKAHRHPYSSLRVIYYPLTGDENSSPTYAGNNTDGIYVDEPSVKVTRVSPDSRFIRFNQNAAAAASIRRDSITAIEYLPYDDGPGWKVPLELDAELDIGDPTTGETEDGDIFVLQELGNTTGCTDVDGDEKQCYIRINLDDMTTGGQANNTNIDVVRDLFVSNGTDDSELDMFRLLGPDCVGPSCIFGSGESACNDTANGCGVDSAWTGNLVMPGTQTYVEIGDNHIYRFLDGACGEGGDGGAFILDCEVDPTLILTNAFDEDSSPQEWGIAYTHTYADAEDVTAPNVSNAVLTVDGVVGIISCDTDEIGGTFYFLISTSPTASLATILATAQYTFTPVDDTTIAYGGIIFGVSGSYYSHCAHVDLSDNSDAGSAASSSVVVVTVPEDDEMAACGYTDAVTKPVTRAVLCPVVH